MASFDELTRPFQEANRRWFLSRPSFLYADRPKGMPGFRRFLELLVQHQATESTWDKDSELEVLIMLEQEGLIKEWRDQKDFHANFRNRKTLAKKLGFATDNLERALTLTEVGSEFVSSAQEKNFDVIEHQLLKLQFPFPDLANRYPDFKLFPYLFTLSLLLDVDGGYITQDEFILRVMLTRNHEEKEGILDWIGQYRNLDEQERDSAHHVFNYRKDITPAQMWLFLFANTQTMDFKQGILSLKDAERARLIWKRSWPRVVWKDYSEEEWGQWMGNFAPGLWPLLPPTSAARLNERRAYVRREESDAHKSLKRHLVENADDLFGRGTKLLEEEYVYPTADAANLVFTLPDGRLLAVEVEVDVGPRDTAGLLQAIKYKYMLAVQEGRDFAEVDGLLVARSISSEVQALCERYNIDWQEVSL
jgi:hypothetical protein